MLDDRETLARAARLGFSASVAGVAIGLLGVSGADGEHVGASGISIWGAIFGIAAFGLLLSIPFGLQAIRMAARPEKTISWEWAMGIWALICAGVLVGSLVLGGAVGYDGSTLGGTVTLVALLESSLIVAVLGTWILFGG